MKAITMRLSEKPLAEMLRIEWAGEPAPRTPGDIPGWKPLNPEEFKAPKEKEERTPLAEALRQGSRYMDSVLDRTKELTAEVIDDLVEDVLDRIEWLRRVL